MRLCAATTFTVEVLVWGEKQRREESFASTGVLGKARPEMYFWIFERSWFGSDSFRISGQLDIEIDFLTTHSFFMKFRAVCAAIFAGFFLAGCGKPDAASAPLTASAPPLPTQAQPKLRTTKLWIGPEELVVEVAETAIQQQTGMMFRTNIPEDVGMIFILPSPQRAAFWMKNCPESLSAAYISPDGVIQEIHHLEKHDTNSVVAASDNIQFVLETKEGWFQRHNISTGVVVRTEFGSLEKTFLQRR